MFIENEINKVSQKDTRKIVKTSPLMHRPYFFTVPYYHQN